MKRCLLTGYPGYLGSFLYQELSREYEVHTLGLEGAPTLQHRVVDLSAEVPVLADVHYDLVVHAAGKAHTVPRTEAERSSFYRVNELGTVHLVKALEGLSSAPSAAVFISTVAVYGREIGARICEAEEVRASDPYGQSKLKAEQAFGALSARGIRTCIVRLPLIVGPDAPGNLGRMVRAIQRGRYFDIAGGKAKRSFVWIGDIARFLRVLAEKGSGVYNLTDGQDASFAQMHEAYSGLYGKRMNPSLPRALALPMAWAGDALELATRRTMPFSSAVLKKMTSDLTFSCDKATRELAWRPTSVLDQLKGADK